ncbi:MAG TPA: hypothetical protein VGD50_03645 [Candidatus Baltobacteraceae bacterium]
MFVVRNTPDEIAHGSGADEVAVGGAADAFTSSDESDAPAYESGQIQRKF